MKTILELKDERALKNDAFEARKKEIFTSIEQEKRGQTDEEKKELEDLISEIRKLDVEISAAEARLQSPTILKREMKKKNTILAAIRAAATHGASMSDESMELINKGNEEMRASGIVPEGNISIPFEMRGNYIQATVATDGKETIQTDVYDLTGALRDALVLPSLGANYLTGLKGNIDMPFYSGTSSAWAGEVAAASNGKGTFSKKSLSPKRLTTYIDVSRQFLEQDTTQAQSLLMRDIVESVAAKFQQTVFGKHASSTTMPDGFFTGKDEEDFVVSGTASYSNIIDLEAAVETANALNGNLGYVTNAAGRALLKKTLRAAGVAEGFIMEGNNLTLNGYKFASTNSVASGLLTTEEDEEGQEGIIFGNWADYIIGQWGGLDLLVDPYTQGVNGTVRILVNVYMDAIKRREESFAIGAMK